MDKVISETVYLEEWSGRRYKLRGCTNTGSLCFCTGLCQERIYLDEQPEPKTRLTSVKELSKLILNKQIPENIKKKMSLLEDRINHYIRQKGVGVQYDPEEVLKELNGILDEINLYYEVLIGNVCDEFFEE